jgi:hypothetical protein
MNDHARNQAAVDAAAIALCDLLHLMAEAERAKPVPAKWDDEYAGHAINSCIDRLFCAPEAGMPRASEPVSVEYHSAYDRARPFLEEDVPLPGSLQEDVDRRARVMYAERWPEHDWDKLRPVDPIRIAIEAEARRDAVAARETA